LGAFVGSRVVDLAGLVGHPAFPSTLEALIARPRGTVLDAARAALEREDELAEWTVRNPRLLAPVLPPSLSAEDNRWIASPGAEVIRPAVGGDTGFDVEVAAVIFRPKKPKLRPSDAGECIFGFTLMHSWFGEEGFAAALGPCVVTADDFDADEEVVTHVNSKLWSAGTVGDAKVSFQEQIVNAAKSEELLPGEVFGSGTLGRTQPDKKPPRTGADVRIEHPSIGVLENRVGPRARRSQAS
jgi:2-keto-4-pentenoate hydratase/2-oxohepta-3-ene-1,7-dioic acid hydratase in catechol pathway